jgi:hypothetical protein
MNLKAKNALTALVLFLVVVSFYVVAVIKAISK